MCWTSGLNICPMHWAFTDVNLTMISMRPKSWPSANVVLWSFIWFFLVKFDRTLMGQSKCRVSFCKFSWIEFLNQTHGVFFVILLGLVYDWWFWSMYPCPHGCRSIRQDGSGSPPIHIFRPVVNTDADDGAEYDMLAQSSVLHHGVSVGAEFWLWKHSWHSHIVLCRAWQECMDKKGPAIESVSGKHQRAQKWSWCVFVVCVFRHMRWKFKYGPNVAAYHHYN